MQIDKLTCSNCGSGQLGAIGSSRFQCPDCQASYSIDFDPSTSALADALVKGDSQSTQVFAVHGKMTITGDANKVLLKDKSAEAQHVGNLEVIGDSNVITVVLLDGATYDLIGDSNKVKRLSGEQDAGGFWTKVRDLF